MLSSFEQCPQKYKWNSQNASIHDKFVHEQQNDRFKKKVDSLKEYECVSVDDVRELNNRITALYREIADKVVPRKIFENNSI